MNAVALLCGVVFSLGLLVSGMVDPEKVIGFLDVAGHWDPSLALVMLGAIAANAVPMRLAMRRQRSLLLHCPMELPKATQITTRLVAGSVVFGVGWGLSGICPGPALVNLGTAQPDRLLFFVFMLSGMGAYELWNRRVSNQRAPATHTPPNVQLLPQTTDAQPALPARLAARGPAGRLTLFVDTPLRVGERYRVLLPGQTPPQARCYVVQQFRPGTREGDAARAILLAYLDAELAPAAQPQTPHADAARGPGQKEMVR